MVNHIAISGRRIGPNEPVYLIAELSANHNGSVQTAMELVEAAARAGADAVKVQTYKADTLTLDSNKEWFRIGKGTRWEGRSLYSLYSEAYMPWEWQPELKRAAESFGMHFFSTPFDPTAVEFLEKIDVPAFKVASFEVVDLPLLYRVGQAGKPVIMSTGMGTMAEIEEAVHSLRDGGAVGVALLKCTSAYPATPEEMNLRTIPHMAEAFDVPTGVSDHSLGIEIPVAATALGACIVEKHLTLSRDAGGPDGAFSLEPDEFRSMVDAVRAAQRALGRVAYGVSPSEAASRVFRRSLFVVRDIAAGEAFTEDNVRSIRPGQGLAPKYLDIILGRKARKRLERGTPLDWSCL